MKRNSIGILSILAATGMMMGSDYQDYDDKLLSTDKIPSHKPFPGSQIYHQKPEVPKGCKLEEVMLTSNKNINGGYKISVLIDIVFGSEKSKQKKLIKLQYEFDRYVLITPLSYLMQVHTCLPLNIVEENKIIVEPYGLGNVLRNQCG